MKYLRRGLLSALFALAVLLLATPSFAQQARSPGSIGIGLGASTVPAGLSMKTMAGGNFAIQGVVGAWRGHGRDWRYGADSLGVGVDFLYEMPPIASGRIVSLGWNYGLGAGVGLGDWGGAVIGGTGVLGLEFNFVPAPIDFVIEYRPGIYIGNSNFDLEFIDATGHIRFWF